MPVTIEKSVFIKDKEGHITVLTENDQVAENTDITMKCDSQRCASRHDGKHTEISWNVDAIKADANALNDNFYRIISLVLDPGNPKPTQMVFCSAQCVRDFLQYEYVAPLSPREQAVLMANNQQAEIAKHKPALNVIPFKPQTEEPASLPAQEPPPCEDCVGENPACAHCNEPLPELPSDVTPKDPEVEVPYI